jgi:hypothetical protein
MNTPGSKGQVLLEISIGFRAKYRKYSGIYGIVSGLTHIKLH